MPVQVIISKSLVSKPQAKLIHQQISQLFLDIHQISDNPFMVPNVIGEVVLVDDDLTFAGKKVAPIAVVELRVPSFTFTTQPQRDRFVAEATDIVFNATQGQLPKSSIWVNAVYAVDGMWGIGGTAYSNQALGEAIQAAAI